MSEQLVDVMMRALCEHHHGKGDQSCDEEQWGDSYIREEMYAILAGIEAAGYEINQKGRLEMALAYATEFRNRLEARS